MNLKTYSPKNKAIPKLTIQMECFTDHPALISVVTMPEACILYQKNKANVLRAIDRGYLDARRAFSGGTYLITVASLEKHWGKPVADIIDEIYEPNKNTGGDNGEG